MRERERGGGERGHSDEKLKTEVRVCCDLPYTYTHTHTHTHTHTKVASGAGVGSH
jgi:hypothetical protein